MSSFQSLNICEKINLVKDLCCIIFNTKYFLIKRIQEKHQKCYIFMAYALGDQDYDLQLALPCLQQEKTFFLESTRKHIMFISLSNVITMIKTRK